MNYKWKIAPAGDHRIKHCADTEHWNINVIAAIGVIPLQAVAASYQGFSLKALQTKGSMDGLQSQQLVTKAGNTQVVLKRITPGPWLTLLKNWFPCSRSAPISRGKRSSTEAANHVSLAYP